MSETSGPVFRGDGATTAFRLEAYLGDWFDGAPEDLVGRILELTGPIGLVRGKVGSVEPYVDAMLGPGHWVTLVDPRTGPEGRL